MSILLGVLGVVFSPDCPEDAMQVALLATGSFSEPGSEYDGWPKPLLPAGSRKVVDHLLERLCPDPLISAIHICTDPGGYPVFREWLRGCDYTGKVSLFRSGSGCERELDGLGKLIKSDFNGDDLLVISGSHLFDLSFGQFIRYAQGLDGDVVGVTDSSDSGGRCARVALTSGGRVIDLGPGNEESDAYSLFPLVRFSSKSLTFVDSYLRGGGDAECLVSLLESSYRVRPLYAYRMKGACYPISGKTALKKIASVFEKNT